MFFPERTVLWRRLLARLQTGWLWREETGRWIWLSTARACVRTPSARSMRWAPTRRCGPGRKRPSGHCPSTSRAIPAAFRPILCPRPMRANARPSPNKTIAKDRNSGIWVARMAGLYWPRPRILHMWLRQRLAKTTRGRSWMRYVARTSGPVREDSSNRIFYRNQFTLMSSSSVFQ